MPIPDMLVVGGGVIGCAVARALARQGMRITLLERGEIGREASWAGAGILLPSRPASYPPALANLCAQALTRYGAFIDEIVEETGIAPEYRKCGLLYLKQDAEDRRDAAALAAWCRQHAMPHQELGADETRRVEPGLGDAATDALFLPDAYQIRNPRLMSAMAASLTHAGVRVELGVRVSSFLTENGSIIGVRTPLGSLHGGSVTVASGAWSRQFLPQDRNVRRVGPSRGQMILLQTSPGRLRRMVVAKQRYLVPRVDGRVLAGTTVEFVGFDRRPTASACAAILGWAVHTAPCLADARVVSAWGGVRPHAEGLVPLIGPVEETPNLLAATGHFRSGLLLAPLTAEFLVSLVAGAPPPFDPRPFAPERAAPP